MFWWQSPQVYNIGKNSYLLFECLQNILHANVMKRVVLGSSLYKWGNSHWKTKKVSVGQTSNKWLDWNANQLI